MMLNVGDQLLLPVRPWFRRVKYHGPIQVTASGGSSNGCRRRDGIPQPPESEHVAMTAAARDDFLLACERYERRIAPPPPKPWSNIGCFISAGYLARVLRQTCRSCRAVAETTEGIFHVEVKPGVSARRLTRLAHGAQWPLAEGLPLEVVESATDWCPACLRTLGFSSEQPAGTSDFLKDAA